MEHCCILVLIMLLLLSALALTLVALLTDWWYRIYTSDNIVNSTTKQYYNFHYGLWRLCYQNIPLDNSSREQDCVTIYDKLIQKDEETFDYDVHLRLHLSRTVVGCAIAAAVGQLSAILSLLCGIWPGRCDALHRPSLFLGCIFIMLLATMCGIASGISFIAVRDLDNAKFSTRVVIPPSCPPFANQVYEWSFMLHWIGTGLAFVVALLLTCLLQNTYGSVQHSSKRRHHAYI